jgi:hypothetical protein
MCSNHGAPEVQDWGANGCVLVAPHTARTRNPESVPPGAAAVEQVRQVEDAVEDLVETNRVTVVTAGASSSWPCSHSL